MSSLFSRVSPNPTRYLTASVAWRVAMTPGVEPRTGKTSGGTVPGKMQAKQAVRPGTNRESIPVRPWIPP